MEIIIDTSKPFGAVQLKGRLGVGDAQWLMEELEPLMRGRETKLAIGLAEVTSIDSGGLSCLINVVTRARLSEGRVILVGPAKFVEGVLEVTQLDRWFEICPDFEEAARRLA